MNNTCLNFVVTKSFPIKTDLKFFLTFLLLLLFINFSYSQEGFVDGNPKIAYWEYGNSETSIIIINGGPGYDHKYLQPEWDTLSKIFRIIYYDQRGCGDSETSTNYSWIEHIKDLKRLKLQLSPNSKVILAGSSWGTNLALVYSIYFPQDVKGLILSGFTDWKGINSKKVDLDNYQLDSILNFRRSLPLSQELDSITKTHQKSKNDYFAKFANNEMSNSNFQNRLYKKTLEMTSQTLKSLKSMPELTYFTDIKVPTLLFKGNLDCGMADWSDILINKIEGLELVVITNSCHDPWFSNPKIFFPKCTEFINKIGDNEHFYKL